VQSGSEPFGLWGITLGEQGKKIEGLDEKGRNSLWLANDSSPAGNGGGGALWTLVAAAGVVTCCGRHIGLGRAVAHN
jgi:hypothetical protein